MNKSKFDSLNQHGITFTVRYMGCIEVNCAMKSLDFETRSLVAKECINRICEAIGIIVCEKRRNEDILKEIGKKPSLTASGSIVNLTITSDCLYMISNNQSLIISHLVPNISFVSSGDLNTLNFVAYIAKDENASRTCYVVECKPELAQEVIATIGQAFEIRYKQQLRNVNFSRLTIKQSPCKSEKSYYNDLPGKTPPNDTEKLQQLSPLPQPQPQSSISITPNSPTPPIPPLPNILKIYPFSSLPKIQTTTNFMKIEQNTKYEQEQYNHEHQYVNEIATKNLFNIKPFIVENDIQDDLENEIWYHGKISRNEAESLIRNDGDFLVRESLLNPGKYILTVMQGDTKKHLLLVDPDGKIRTKEKLFDSISHLIYYHCENALPIISTESALLLCTPVHRKKNLKLFTS